ncbi:MAG TPA: SHOCT domain-containing protein [Egibacteraceae bacterium]|nr:SHOCT domain-containing protein [Egibacteraceae bacterium]
MTFATMLAILAQTQRWDGHMMWGWGSMWIVGVLSMLLVAAVIIGGVWAAASGGRRQPDPAGRAREILNERYARGEISTDEYRERLEALR